MPRTGSRGWYVEIDHPSGHTHRPRVLDDVSLQPAVNDYPTIEVPVPRADRWRAAAFEDAPMRVWKDARRYPVETLIGVDTEPERTVLRGRGGEQLQRRIEAEYGNRPVHEVADELITTHTDYISHVDVPDTTSSERLVQSVTTTSDWLGVTQDVDFSVLPVEVAVDTLRLTPSCATGDGYRDAADTNVSFATGADYTGNSPDDGFGTALRLSAVGDYGEWTFSLEHEIPEAEVGAHIRHVTPTDGTPGVRFYLDGQELDHLTASDTIGRTVLNWTDHAQSPFNGTGWTGGALAPGPHTIRVEVDASGGGPLDVDHLAFADNSYAYNFDNTIKTAADGTNYLDGPEHYPDAETIRLDPYQSILSVVSGDLVSSWDDITGNQHVGITNDGDAGLITAANSESVAGTFAGPSGEIQAEVRLARYGDAGAGNTPRYGISGQAVASYDLVAGLDDTPLVLNRRFDGALIDVLNDLADLGNFAFEIVEDATGAIAVEWTQIGQRTADDSIRPADYQVTKRTDERYQRAVVYGSNQSVRREQFVADHGVAVPLANERLNEGSDIVYDPTDETTFERGEDYELGHSAGEITTLSGGAMTTGETYRIDYEFETRGSWTAPHAENWADEEIRTLVEEIPALSTSRACGQAAHRIVSVADSPQYEATVTLPREAAFSVVETLDIPGFPETEALHIRRVETRPGETSLSLGSRLSVDEVIGDINDRIQSVSRRV